MISTIICWAATIYMLIIFLRVIFSWFPIDPYGTAAKGYLVLYRLTEPTMGALRRVIPPIRTGRVAFDLSAVIIMFALLLIRVVVC